MTINVLTNPYSAEVLLNKPQRSKRQFEITINVLVSFFRFIWMPMLRVYGHYKYFHSYSAGIVFRRQNLTSKVDPCAVRVGINNCADNCYCDWFYIGRCNSVQQRSKSDLQIMTTATSQQHKEKSRNNICFVHLKTKIRHAPVGNCTKLWERHALTL